MQKSQNYLNPQHQNININISYNLNTNKLTKALLGGKKISNTKTKKVNGNVFPTFGNQIINNISTATGIQQSKKYHKKQLKKNIQSQARQSKGNVKKLIIKKKKIKDPNLATIQAIPDSKDQIIQYYNPFAHNSKDFLKRNIQSPDIFKPQQNRKIKTESSCMDFNSTFKKIKKIPANSAYLQGKHNFMLKEPQTGGVNMNQINTNKNNTSNLVNLLYKKSIMCNSTSKTTKNKKSLSIKQKRYNTQQNQLFYSNPINQSQNQHSQVHNRSCMLYSTKKNYLTNNSDGNNYLQNPDHIISTYGNLNQNQKKARKRVQSAETFNMKNDKKLVSKLLNMSIISSEGLGSSQLISSQRMKSARNNITKKKFGLKVDEFDDYAHIRNEVRTKQLKQNGNQKQQNMQGNALRQYLNSVDLRIIKSIEDDTEKLLSTANAERSALKQNCFIQYQQILHKKSFQRLMILDKNDESSSIYTNQRKDMISYYNQLFANVLHNKKIQDQMEIEEYESRKSISLYSSDIVKKQKFFIQSFDSQEDLSNFKMGKKKTISYYNQNEQSDEKYIKEEHQKELKEQKQIKNNKFKLNFQNYKNIISKTVNEAISPEIQKQERKIFSIEQSENHFQIGKRPIQFQQRQSNQEQQNQHNDSDEYQNLLIPSDSQRSGKLSSFKQQQIERWNNINKILGQKIGGKSQNGEDSNQQKIMEELIKQSNMNKRWIEQNQMDYFQQEIPFQEVEFNQTKKNNRQRKSHAKSKSDQVYIVSKDEQLCWEYDQQELKNQIQENYKEKKNKKLGNNIKINNFLNQIGHSQDNDNGSGEQSQFDNKKYSENTSIFHEEDQKNQNNNHKKDDLDQFQKEEDQDFKQEYEQNQENNELRGWIDQQKLLYPQNDCNPANNNQNQSEEEKKSKNNYLECSLEGFGFKNSRKANQQNHQIYQRYSEQQKNQDLPISQRLKSKQTNSQLLSISLKIYPITEPTTKTFQKSSKVDLATSSLLSSDAHRKRLTHIVEDIILILIKEFAKDISIILKKASSTNTHKKQNFTQQEIQENTSPLKEQFFRQNSNRNKEQESLNNLQSEQKKNQLSLANKRNNFVAKSFGVDTSFFSIQKYLKKFKQFILKRQNVIKYILININKDIGPNSLQILSYLRSEYGNQCQNQSQPQNMLDQNNHQKQMNENEQILQDEDGLFVVPSDTFESFEDFMQKERQQTNKNLQPEKQINFTNRQKAYLNFWHRSIFESYNQFLDFERPYGINGKPYDWVQERKKFRQVQSHELEIKLQKGIQKLMQAMSLPSGIIYDKFDCPIMYAQLSSDQKMILNQERLSRMLAIELFQSEESWINYNDELAELLVELSRMIEERIYLQMSTQLKKLKRRRNLMLENQIQKIFMSSEEDQLCQRIESKKEQSSFSFD